MLLETLAAVNIKSEMIFSGNSAKHISSYPELIHLQENVPLRLLAQNWGLPYLTALSFMSSLPSDGNLRNNSYMKKIHFYVFLRIIFDHNKFPQLN